MPELRLPDAATYLGLSQDGVRKRIRNQHLQARQDERGHWWVTVEEADRRSVEGADARDIEIVQLRTALDEVRHQRDRLEKDVDLKDEQIAAFSRRMDVAYALLTRLLEQHALSEARHHGDAESRPSIVPFPP